MLFIYIIFFCLFIECPVNIVLESRCNIQYSISSSYVLTFVKMESIVCIVVLIKCSPSRILTVSKWTPFCLKLVRKYLCIRLWGKPRIIHNGVMTARITYNLRVHILYRRLWLARLCSGNQLYYQGRPIRCWLSLAADIWQNLIVRTSFSEAVQLRAWSLELGDRFTGIDMWHPSVYS